jgi:hypothetical protein
MPGDLALSELHPMPILDTLHLQHTHPSGVSPNTLSCQRRNTVNDLEQPMLRGESRRRSKA